MGPILAKWHTKYSRLFLSSLLLMILVTFGTLLLLAIGELLVVSESPRMVDAIVVLGTPATSHGSPTEVMKARVRKTVELYRSGYASRVIFSGSAVRNGYIEAEVMSKLAIELGLPESSVVLETQAKNTLENARFSKRILDAHNWSSAIIVTSPYHTVRAGEAFRDAGATVYVISALDPEDLSLFTRVKDVFHELMAFSYLKVTGSQSMSPSVYRTAKARIRTINFSS